MFNFWKLNYFTRQLMVVWFVVLFK